MLEIFVAVGVFTFCILALTALILGAKAKLVGYGGETSRVWMDRFTSACFVAGVRL